MTGDPPGPGAKGSLHVQEGDGALLFDVRVNPRASREALAGVRNGALELRLNAPPVDGAANAAAIKLLAKCLGVPQRAVTLVAGQRARNKRFRVEGVSAAQLRAVLEASEAGR
ncbi:MAG: DUF167 domain-containing protein [Myxococcales bacterium]|nr:DUF167 domain-containing protein [Myxococcales bacterium]